MKADEKISVKRDAGLGLQENPAPKYCKKVNKEVKSWSMGMKDRLHYFRRHISHLSSHFPSSLPQFFNISSTCTISCLTVGHTYLFPASMTLSQSSLPLGVLTLQFPFSLNSTFPSRPHFYHSGLSLHHLQPGLLVSLLLSPLTSLFCSHQPEKSFKS